MPSRVLEEDADEVSGRELASPWARPGDRGGFQASASRWAPGSSCGALAPILCGPEVGGRQVPREGPPGAHALAARPLPHLRWPRRHLLTHDTASGPATQEGARTPRPWAVLAQICPQVLSGLGHLSLLPGLRPPPVSARPGGGRVSSRATVRAACAGPSSGRSRGPACGACGAGARSWPDPVRTREVRSWGRSTVVSRRSQEGFSAVPVCLPGTCPSATPAAGWLCHDVPLPCPTSAGRARGPRELASRPLLSRTPARPCSAAESCTREPRAKSQHLPAEELCFVRRNRGPRRLCVPVCHVSPSPSSPCVTDCRLTRYPCSARPGHTQHLRPALGLLEPEEQPAEPSGLGCRKCPVTMADKLPGNTVWL
ncbi:uncharacterized protein LOC144323513 isoform X1 [Canis aureus]